MTLRRKRSLFLFKGRIDIKTNIIKNPTPITLFVERATNLVSEIMVSNPSQDQIAAPRMMPRFTE